LPHITIGVGGVLIALGLIGYFPGQISWTALIPAIFGVILAILGGVALQPSMRKHAMHVAVMVGLIGLIAGLVRAVLVALKGEIANEKAFAMVVTMAVVCAVFVGLCIKSFIDARRRRQQTSV
jgi:uncharacterized membrane protein